MSPLDRPCSDAAALICCTQARDRRDRVVVTEKLDGHGVRLFRRGGCLVAQDLCGIPAEESNEADLRNFASWAKDNASAFERLPEGATITGEWIDPDLSRRYAVTDAPFIGLDVFLPSGKGTSRLAHDDARQVMSHCRTPGAAVLHDGGPILVSAALDILGPLGRHGAIVPAEGVVYRVERRRCFDFLAKWVRLPRERRALVENG